MSKKIKLYSEDQYQRFIQTVDALKQQLQEGNVAEIGIYSTPDRPIGDKATYAFIDSQQPLALLFILDDLIQNTEWKS